MAARETLHKATSTKRHARQLKSAHTPPAGVSGPKPHRQQQGCGGGTAQLMPSAARSRPHPPAPPNTGGHTVQITREHMACPCPPRPRRGACARATADHLRAPVSAHQATALHPAMQSRNRLGPPVAPMCPGSKVPASHPPPRAGARARATAGPANCAPPWSAHKNHTGPAPYMCRPERGRRHLRACPRRRKPPPSRMVRMRAARPPKHARSGLGCAQHKQQTAHKRESQQRAQQAAWQRAGMSASPTPRGQALEARQQPGPAQQTAACLPGLAPGCQAPWHPRSTFHPRGPPATRAALSCRRRCSGGHSHGAGCGGQP